jgi:hypothetical protein
LQKLIISINLSDNRLCLYKQFSYVSIAQTSGSRDPALFGVDLLLPHLGVNFIDIFHYLVSS